jgi:hypothetical protein
MCHSLVVVNSVLTYILQLLLGLHYITDLKKSAVMNKVQMSEQSLKRTCKVVLLCSKWHF